MANRLIHCKSPYLLQHARNPVDWYPWGDEAFQKARQEEKLIFLSIGYSTCHWCHVMERESFSDADVAALLNRYYVSIKVDREERPDLDHVYMAVCQALTGQGGWPLTVILTPDQKPVFAGTYFPKESRFGLPGLRDILPRIAEMWRQDRSGLDEAGDKIMAAVEGLLRNRPGPLTPAMVDQGFHALSADYDAEYGGFGSAPKFPTSHNMLFLLRYWREKGEESALAMAQKTLHAMYRGGIYDHIGFGFARYSTDREWRVPHFEKMLYDNALLAYAYLEAYQATRDPFYARVAREVFSYVRREMTSPEGAFYTAQDADSEGMEGKFYLWTPAEVKAVLGEEDGSLFCTAYDVTGEGHFQGKSVPNLIRASLPETAKRLGLSEDALFARLEEARRALFAARRRRVPPHTDDKILTASNALMIAALAKGARVLGDGELRGQAQAALDFVLSRLRRPDGRLLARYRDGEAAFPAYLDDYAYLVWALIEMYESNFDPGYLRLALELNARMLDLFSDEDSGGLFFYGKDADTLVARPKEVYDGATPSGNSVAALNLLHLARLTADKRLEERAQAHLEAFAGEVSRHPAGHTFFLLALQLAFAPSREAVVVGQPGAKDTEAMLQELRTAYDPHMLLLFRPTGEEGQAIAAVAPFLREMNALDGGKATAYLCRNYACQAPTTDPNDLGARLTAGRGSVDKPVQTPI